MDHMRLDRYTLTSRSRRELLTAYDFLATSRVLRDVETRDGTFQHRELPNWFST